MEENFGNQEEKGKNPDGLKIQNGFFLAYEERGEEVVVPEGVHTIGEDAFKACVSLKKVVLPRSLRRIMPRAFKGCRNLRELEIPEGVSEIGEYAFHRCHSLEKIQLPVSVQELGSCVFLYCDSLREACIPGVRRLGRQAFLNDTRLERLVIARELEADCIRDVFTSCGRLREVSFADGERHMLSGPVEAAIGEIDLPPLIRQIAADVLSMFELDGHCLVRFLTNLKYVEIPEGIEEIGKSCFFDRRGILSVRLPASLKEIKSRAFRNCISLEEVSFANELVKIDSDAFQNCTSLKRLVMPDGSVYSMQGIGNLAENGKVSSQGNASAAENDFPELVHTVRGQVLANFRLCGTVLLKYLGSESRVAVPNGVTAIAEEAFAGKEEIDRILLPESLNEIGAGAFRGCLLLQTIPIPDSVCKIGEGAFENCVKLLRISLPNRLERIEAAMFRHCRKLKEIHFGANLRAVGEQAFYGCVSLPKVELPESLTAIGTMAFYRCNKLENIDIPAGVEQAGNLAFAQSGVKRVQIRSSGKGFGRDLFAGCVRLNTLVLCEGVRHIPDKLAFGCTALETVILPESISSIGQNAMEKTPFLQAWKKRQQDEEKRPQNEPVSIAEQIFWDGSGLAGEIALAESFRMIAGGACYGNEHITSITLPKNAIWVGRAAFKGCTALTEAVWPDGINDAEPEIFSGCFALEVIRNAPAWRRIGERAFWKCKKLERLCLKKLEYIGKEAFSGCTVLEKTEVGEVEFIGEAAFADTPFTFRRHSIDSQPPCSDPKRSEELWMPDFIEVSSIMVERCWQQQFASPKEGTTGLAPYLFYKDFCLSTLNLPESIRWIGEGAFSGCAKLSKITFPQGNCQIDARAFEKCTSLKTICLHTSKVDESAFAWCTSLEEVVLIGTVQLGAHAFEGCKNLKTFTLLPDAQDTADAAASDLSGKSEVLDLVIGDFCFCGCGQLAEIDLRKAERIGRYAFENCDSLREIALSCDAEIAPYAFADCGRLMQIHIMGNEAKLSLKEYALSGCTALKYAAFGSDLVSEPEEKGKNVNAVYTVKEKKTSGGPVSLEGSKVQLKDFTYVWELSAYSDLFSAQIPEAVRMIFYNALSCFDIERDGVLCAYHGNGRILHIPEGIRQIRAEVFRDMPTLAEIYIPESVTYIGARAFHGTEWLKKQQKLSLMVTVNHMLLDGSGCKGEVVIPKEIRMVCGWAFANGMEIREIRFTDASVKVEEFAFRNCIYLEKIHLPNQPAISLFGISDRDRELPPLAKQIVMERLNCFKTDKENALVECTGNIVTLLVADGITRIGDGVFQESNLLTEIVLPQTVTAIGKRAFAGCKWLQSVKQPKGKKIKEEKKQMESAEKNPDCSGGIREIGFMAFSSCKWLTSVELSEAFQSLGARAFEHCTSLQEILLPEGLEEIPERAFFRCHSLKEVKLPSTLKRIGKEAFAFCKELAMPELPDGVEVGERAFIK